MRFLLMVLATSLALGVSACGDSNGGGSTTSAPATTTTAATTTTPARPTTLTAQGYAALVQFTYLTNRKLSPAKFASRCDGLGKGAGDYNEEVGAVREVCVTLGDIQQASADVAKCPKKSSDALVNRRCVADGLDQIAAYSADAIDASKQIVVVNDLAAGPCRAYLLDPRETQRMRDFNRSVRSTATVLRDENASPERLQRAANQLEIAFKRFDRSSTSRSEQLSQARACRPAPA